MGCVGWQWTENEMQNPKREKVGLGENWGSERGDKDRERHGFHGSSCIPYASEELRSKRKINGFTFPSKI